MRQEIFRSLVRQRFGATALTDIEQRITTASFEQLGRWIFRVIPAATITELLADE